jgi:O-antigen ligase
MMRMLNQRTGLMASILQLACLGNLLMLLLADRYSSWHHATLMLPWALVLSSSSLRAHVVEVAHAYKVLTGAAVILTLLILLGCGFLACSRYQVDAALVPVLWLAIAGFTRSGEMGSHRAMFNTIVMAVLVVSGNVLWQYFAEARSRPRGLSFNVLTSPMVMAMLCLLCIIASTGEQWRNRYIASVTVFSGALGILASICTQSKTGLIAFVLGTIAYMMFSTKRLRTIFFATPIIAIWTFTLMPTFQAVMSDVNGYKRGIYVSSAGDRTDGIRWGTQHLMDAPILGLGDLELQRQFNLRGYEWKRPNPDMPFIEHLHNDYLQIAVSYGIPALLCFLTMWFALIARAFQARLPASRWLLAKPATPWVMSMSAIYLFAFGTDSFSHWIFTWGTVTSSLGIAAGLMMRSPAEAPARTG